MRNRVLALAGAVALIAAAVLARQALTDDDPPSAAGGNAPRVACSPELAEVCDALAEVGAIAADPPTLTLADADTDSEIDGVDGWVTWDPAPAVTNFDTGTETWGAPAALGSAELVLLASDDTDATLVDRCDGPITWTCVRDLDAQVGLGPPDTAEGLARILPLARAATLDGEGDPETLDAVRLRRILDSPTNGPDDAQDSTAAIVVRGSGAFDAVVVPAGLAEAAVDSAQGAGLSVVAPTPTAAATVVVSPRGAADVGSVVAACGDEQVTDALRDVGVEACEGTVADDEVAGFGWQVRKRTG